MSTKMAYEGSSKCVFGSKVVFVLTSSWLLILATLSFCCGAVISGLISLMLALFYWVVSAKRLDKIFAVSYDN